MIIHLINHRARITEVDDASDQLINLYSKSREIQKEEVLKTIIATMRKQSDDITEAIKRSRAESELEAVDIERDNAVRMLNNVIVGYKSMPNPDWAESGSRLAAVFDKYGLAIVSESYSNESSLIESLLFDLSNASLQADIDKLAGMRDCINNLRAAEDKFNGARETFNAANAEAKLATSASEIRRELLSTINGVFISYVKVLVMTNEKLYGSFALKVDDIITKINLSIASRYDKKSDEAPKENSNK